jgi:hypothetical protein
MSQGPSFHNGVLSTDASRDWTLVSTCRSWFLSHRSWDVNWFSKLSAVMLAFSFRWYVVSNGPCTVVGAFGSSSFKSDYAIGHRPWSVTSQFHTFVSHHLNAFLRVIHLIVLVTQLTAVLHAGSWVTCCSFLNLHLCFSRLTRPGRYLLRSESVILHLDSLYAEAIEAVKSLTTLSASSPKLIWILDEFNSEARLWNRSQSVNLSAGSKRFLVLMWSSGKRL